MRRPVLLGVLLLSLLGLVACSDDDPEPSASGGDSNVTDDSAPDSDASEEPPGTTQTSEPTGGAVDLESVVEATAAANAGRYEVADDIDGDGLRSPGAFEQDPPAFTVEYPPSEGEPLGDVVIVDGTAYAQDGDGPWEDLGDADVDGDALLDVGPRPARMLEILLELGEPAELDAQAGRLFQWEAGAAELGLNADYEDTPATVEVEVDDEDRVTSVTITAEAASDTLDGGVLSLTFTYDPDAPPITAPAEFEPFDAG